MAEQRAVRHVRSIQVRNFTPFPARDTLASTLLHAPAHPTPLDDTDAILLRRRSRKISSNSLMTLHHYPVDSHDTEDAEATPRARKRTSSKGSSLSGAPIPTPSATILRPSIPGSASATPTLRRGRPRTTSHSSAFETTAAYAQQTLEPSPLTQSISYISDTFSSQKDLEDIIWSRLIPTFLTIGQGRPSLPDDPPPASRSTIESASNVHNGKPIIQAPTVAKEKVQSSVFSLKRDASRHAESPSRKRDLTKSQSPGPARRANGAASPAASPKKLIFPQSPPLTPPPGYSEPAAPIYMSSFHRPSTNPVFDIEADGRGLSHSSEFSAGQIRVQLWGQGQSEVIKGLDNGKGKCVLRPSDGDSEWKVFRTWDVDLSDLIPLPDEASVFSIYSVVYLQHSFLRIAGSVSQ